MWEVVNVTYLVAPFITVRDGLSVMGTGKDGNQVGVGGGRIQIDPGVDID